MQKFEAHKSLDKEQESSRSTSAPSLVCLMAFQKSKASLGSSAGTNILVVDPLLLISSGVLCFDWFWYFFVHNTRITAAHIEVWEDASVLEKFQGMAKNRI